MKLTWGPVVLAFAVALGGAPARGAFWKKGSDGKTRENVNKASENPTAYAPDLESGSQPVRSLASYPQRSMPEASAPRSFVAPAEESEPRRRAHFQIQDEESANTLVKLAESRRLREEEIRVLVRLHKEKEGELGRMDQRLNNRFAIVADENYQYDNETKSLFLLVAKEQTEAEVQNPEELFEKRLHMILRDKESEVEFVRLVSAKKITASEMQVLKLLLKEKNLELTKVYEALQERFGILREKHYEYDADSRILFEVVRTDNPVGNITGTTLNR